MSKESFCFSREICRSGCSNSLPMPEKTSNFNQKLTDFLIQNLESTRISDPLSKRKKWFFSNPRELSYLWKSNEIINFILGESKLIETSLDFVCEKIFIKEYKLNKEILRIIL